MNPPGRGRPRRAAPVLAALDRGVAPSQAAIVAELRRALVHGAAPPGSPLPLDDLADAFSVSRIPVREALKTLQAEGLVEHEARGGYAVARLDRAEYAEMYAVRGALEAAALAGAVRRAGRRDRDEVAAIHAEQTARLARGDVPAWDAGSRDFHAALVAPSGMRRLTGLLALASNTLGLARPMSLLSSPTLAALHDEHAAMASAFLAGDADALTRVAADHMARLSAAFDPD